MTQTNQIQKRKSLILADLLKNKAKISEIESKIPSVSGLAKTSALTAVENKIHNVSNLIKKDRL